MSRKWPEPYVNHWDTIYPKLDAPAVCDACDVPHDVPDEVSTMAGVTSDICSVTEEQFAESEGTCQKNERPKDNNLPRVPRVKIHQTQLCARLPDIDFWTAMQDKLSNCMSYAEIKAIVQSETRDYHMSLTQSSYGNDNFITNQTASHYYPDDAPVNMKPVKCYGDGNCFMRSISKLVFGSESHHLAVRAAVVFEAVIHKNYFLDNTYLSGERPHANYLPTQYAIYLESYNSVNTSSWNSRTIEDIYEHEVVSLTKLGCYCGMWQFYQAANIAGRPILSIYPTGFLTEQYREDMNRKYPQSDCTSVNWIHCALCGLLCI